MTNGGELLCDAVDQLNPKIGKLSGNDDFLIYWDDLRSSGKEFLNNVFAQSYTPGTQDLSNDIFLEYSYKIESAYPNPFNPSISIEFSLDRSDIVKLSVYERKNYFYINTRLSNKWVAIQLIGRHQVKFLQFYTLLG